jgi:hypothetical protein
MSRQLSRVALALSLAALAAPVSHASSTMCVGRERCGITRGYVFPARAASEPLVAVVPMRSDGSQHGGISWFRARH